MVHIVVLQLENNCFFIGKTYDILFNINTYNRNCNDFTKKYKPIKLYEFKQNCNEYDLDLTVKKYMNKYGINNVRGGSYSELELSNEQYNILQKELYIVNNNNDDISLLNKNNINQENNKNEVNNTVFINNKVSKNPVIIQNYIWYWECSICNKNAVGTVQCSNFNFVITSPTCLDENKNIKKIAICDLCLKQFKLDDFTNPKLLINTNNNKYQIKGFEQGQYYREA